MTRSDRVTRWSATALAALAGLGIASVHWLGLVAGAALVALPQRTTGRGSPPAWPSGPSRSWSPRGLLLTGPDALPVALEMTQPLGVAVGVALVGGAVGGLVRGVVG
ncbi:hypothetical protein [Halobaculum litoreum]|uniref:Uncharacterized protein n=1 Tax=Halobaculum litoreum TaxID=3031998 RepID=A0ABD5XRY1_9EURY|nr:hypothetical protein [Halobaculum sp. DT92]